MIKQLKKAIFTALPAFAFGLGLTLLAAPSMAVHKASGQLVCGQCHTMHNSQGSAQMVAAGPQTKLLRASGAKVHELCLSCHASAGSANTGYPNSVGANVNPPAVWRGTSVVGTNFYTLGAGGDFMNIGSVDSGGAITYTTPGDDPGVNPSLGYGHSIGATAVTPPGAASAAITNFGCINCHDAHGSVSQPTADSNTAVNVFRNLRARPLGAGGGMAQAGTGVIFNNVGNSSTRSYAGGASQAAIGGLAANLVGLNNGSTNHIWPVWVTAASQNVYCCAAGATVSATIGMSGWCAQCHDQWHEDSTAANKSTADWTRHPIDVDMQTTTTGVGEGFAASGSGVVIIDWAHYNTTVPNPTGTTARKLPMQQSAVAGTVYYGDGAVDNVFCLSCHFAHAGPFFDSLRWDYTSAVSAGSQNGKSLDSTTGCQQCHNR